MSEPLAASRRVKENRFFQNRVELGPPGPPPLPGGAHPPAAGKTQERMDLEEHEEIAGFLKEGGAVADGVRRVIRVIKDKRRTLGTEWDVRGAVANFVQMYRVAVPKADPEYLRGMQLALKVYLGSKEAI